MTDAIKGTIAMLQANHDAMNRTVTPYSVTIELLNDIAEAAPNGGYRKCRDCGSVAYHVDNITPYVLCRQCGSQDTRKVAK